MTIKIKNRSENILFKDVKITNENKKLVFYLKDFLKNREVKFNTCENIIILGKPGLGKTFIANAFCNELKNIVDGFEVEKWFHYGYNKEEVEGHDCNQKNFQKIIIEKRNFKVVKINFKELIRKLRLHFKTKKDATKEFHNCDFLLIDEIGIGYNSDAERNELYDIINYRNEYYKPTMIISNHSLTSKNDNKGIDKIIGARNFDRITAFPSKVFNLKGKSYRQIVS